MKRYRVRWIEEHEEEVLAENEDYAWDFVDIGVERKTYRHASLQSINEIAHPNDDLNSPDDMGRAKIKKESAP